MLVRLNSHVVFCGAALLLAQFVSVAEAQPSYASKERSNSAVAHYARARAMCVETLEEIDMLNRDIFMQAGGESFNYIPALNDTGKHINALYDLIVNHLQGWSSTRESNDKAVQEKQLQQQLAKQLGAGQ